jgi:hypothetical protein
MENRGNLKVRRRSRLLKQNCHVANAGAPLNDLVRVAHDTFNRQ